MTNRAIRNAAFLMATQAITWVLTWILIVYLPRYLGDEGFGKLFFATSFATLCAMFINLGINTYLVKEVARDREQGPDLLANVLAIELILSVVIAAVMLLIVRCLNLSDEGAAAALIIGLSLVVGALGSNFSSYFQGLEKSYVPAVALIIEKVLVTALCVAALTSGYGLIAVCWIMFLGAVARVGFMAAAIYRQIPFGLRIDPKAARTVLAGSAPFLIWVVFSEIYIRIDVVMLQALTTDEVVGWYGAAFRLYATLLFIPNIFITTVFPALTRKFANPDESANVATRRTLNLMLFVCVPVGLGTTLVAPHIVGLIYGFSQFAHAVENLQIFGFCIVFVCVDVVLGTVLIANNKQKAWSYAAILAALLNPACNLILIPLSQRALGNGGYGAAISTLITEIFMMAVAIKLMPKGIFTAATLRTTLKSIVAGSAMYLAVLCLPSMAPLMGLIVTISLGAFVYLGVALALRVLPKEDTAHLRHAILSR